MESDLLTAVPIITRGYMWGFRIHDDGLFASEGASCPGGISCSLKVRRTNDNKAFWELVWIKYIEVIASSSIHVREVVWADYWVRPSASVVYQNNPHVYSDHYDIEICSISMTIATPNTAITYISRAFPVYRQVGSPVYASIVSKSINKLSQPIPFKALWQCRGKPKSVDIMLSHFQPNTLKPHSRFTEC